jgi:hypothetical protein
VSLNRTYIGYFNSILGTDPELGVYNNNKTSYNLRYYIDEFGNTIKPINDSRGINLGIMNQNWTEDTVAISLVTNPNNSNSSLNGSFDIFKSGKVIEPILYSQYSLYNSSGSTIGYTYTSSIGFQAPVGSADINLFSLLLLQLLLNLLSNYLQMGGLLGVIYLLIMSQVVVL